MGTNKWPQSSYHSLVHEICGLLCSCLIFKKVVCVCVSVHVWISFSCKSQLLVPFYHVQPAWFTFVSTSLSASLLEQCVGLQPKVLAVEDRKAFHHGMDDEKNHFPNSHLPIFGPSQEFPKYSSLPKCFSFPISTYAVIRKRWTTSRRAEESKIILK